MPNKSKRKPGKARPTWERGYQSHGFWQGKKKIGWVELSGRGMDGVYRWQAGSRAGEAKTLGEAKRAVEETVLSLASQLPLFGDPTGD
jgi:hypothetical protein